MMAWPPVPLMRKFGGELKEKFRTGVKNSVKKREQLPIYRLIIS